MIIKFIAKITFLGRDSTRTEITHFFINLFFLLSTVGEFKTVVKQSLAEFCQIESKIIRGIQLKVT